MPRFMLRLGCRAFYAKDLVRAYPNDPPVSVEVEADSVEDARRILGEALTKLCSATPQPTEKP